MQIFTAGKLKVTVNGSANHRCPLPVRTSHINGLSVEKDRLGSSCLGHAIFCLLISFTYSDRSYQLFFQNVR